MNINWAKIVRWLVVLAMPILLTLGTLRLIIVWDSPNYPSFEYGRIGPDRFGFTQEERLDLAVATLDYLRSSEPANEAIRLLEELQIPGSDQPLYNEREVGHMHDVKKLTDLFRQMIWAVGIVVVAGLLFLLLNGRRRTEGYRAIMYGGLFATGALLLVIVLIGLSWNFVFTQFHEILFPPDTWTFLYSDSLIRLFPEKFWFDFGLLWTGVVLFESIVLTVLGYLLLKRAT